DSATYGQSDVGQGERVLLEFVSANPTGPLHVGHGRGAVFGDALAKVMRAGGYDVDTEYYINNVGNQISKLGESVWHWVVALAQMDDPSRDARIVGEKPELPDGFPEDGYRGGYIAQIALSLVRDTSGLHLGLDAPNWEDAAWWAEREPGRQGGRQDDRAISDHAWRLMIARIAKDLALLGIEFSGWHSERSLHGLEPGKGQTEASDQVSACVARLSKADWCFDGEADEAGRTPVCFKGTREDIPKSFRDTKDRVVVRSDGRPTYFAADIAYHDNKLQRGYDHLINVLGADHHGYVPRLKGVIHALGDLRKSEGDPKAARWSGDRLEVQLMQMVALLRDGSPVSMGKRSGDFVTLADVVKEVSTGTPNSGRDAVRFIFLTRKGDAQLDFDLEVARRTSMDNPVYYVQYGHARLASILRKAAEQGIDWRVGGVSLEPLAHDLERQLALTIAAWPEVVARAARTREPHQVAFFLLDACKQFHSYFTQGKKADLRVIGDNLATTRARLTLIAALKQVIGNALAMLGVSAPEKMEQIGESEKAEKSGE
ncbi:MAG: arginine--tRNA ligase, partial [Myxococcales bacterium]|nr:arginine--tRNA ligase [Myxococcales bacterium]